MAEIVIKLVNGELAGKTIQEINKNVRDANKELTKAAVGTDEWVKAHSKLEGAKKLQGDLKKQIDNTSAASGVLKKSFGGVLSQIPGFQQLSAFLGEAQGGVGGLSSSFGILKGAIAATGLGLLLLLIGSLIAAMTKFTPVIDKVEQIMSGLANVVDELTGRLQNFASGIWDIITRTPGGVDKVSNSFRGLGSSIKEAYDAGVELKILQQDLDDLNRGIAISNAAEEAQIERLLVKARDQNALIRDKTAALNEAKIIAQENFKANDELDKKNLDALLREAELSSKLSKDEVLRLAEGTLAQEVEYARRGTLSDELLQKITDAQVKVIQNEGRNNVLLEKIIVEENKIRQKQAAANEKAAAEERKRQDELAKATEERLKQEVAARQNTEDLKIQLIGDAMTREIEQLKLDTVRKMEALVGTEDQIREQKALLKTIELEEIARIEENYALQRAERDRQAKEEQSQRDQEAAEEKKRIAEEIAAAEAATNEIRIDSARSTTAGLGELLQSQIKNEKAARGVRKSFAIADIAIGLVQELGANSAAAAKIAAQAPPYTIPAGAAYLAAANGRSIIRAGIATAKVLLFRKGGLLKGPSHEAGGIPGEIRSSGQPIEMEGNEFIFSKKATQAIGAKTLGRINDHFTRKFAAGGPVSPFNDRAPISSGAAQSSGSDPFNMSAILESQERRTDALIASINARIDRIVVVNKVSDTADGIKTLNMIQEDADV